MMKSKSLGKTEDKQMSHKQQQQQRTACDSMNKQQKNVCVCIVKKRNRELIRK